MTPERWRQVEEIFQAALDLSPEDRNRYVLDVCANDTELKRDVESLLTQYDSAGELLEEPAYGNTEMNVLESFVEDKDPMSSINAPQSSSSSGEWTQTSSCVASAKNDRYSPLSIIHTSPVCSTEERRKTVCPTF